MVNELIDWIKGNPKEAVTLIPGAIGLFAGGLWTALVFFHKVLSEREQKQFDRYRLLVRNLNVGEDGENPYIDFQMDAIYQMRFFRKYYPRSLWMLNRLKIRWENQDKERLLFKLKPIYNIGHLQEIEETIAYISHRKTWIGVFLFFFYDMWPLFQLKKNALKKIQS